MHAYWSAYFSIGLSACSVVLTGYDHLNTLSAYSVVLTGYDHLNTLSDCSVVLTGYDNLNTTLSQPAFLSNLKTKKRLINSPFLPTPPPVNTHITSFHITFIHIYAIPFTSLFILKPCLPSATERFYESPNLQFSLKRQRVQVQRGLILLLLYAPWEEFVLATAAATRRKRVQR